MSLIIEDELFVLNKTNHQSYQNPANPDLNILKKFIFQNELTNRTFQNVALHNYTNQDRAYLKFLIPFKKRIFSTFDLWYSAKLDNNGIYLEQKIILAKDQFPLIITPFKKKLQAIKLISKNKQAQPKFIKISINQLGYIQARLPKIIFMQNIVNSFKPMTKGGFRTQPFLFYVQNIIKLVISDSKETLKNIFRQVTEFNLSDDNQIKQLQKDAQQKKIRFQLFRYLARSSIQLRFDCTEGSALYEQVVDITITEQKQIQQRINHMKNANKFQLTSLNIYMQAEDIFEAKQKQAFYMSGKQKDITKSLLQIPQIIPIKQGSGSNKLVLENKYMFNHIALELPYQNQKLSLLGQSGFGRIQFGTFDFWYLTNNKMDREQLQQCLKQSSKVKNKYLVVKSPKLTDNKESVDKYQLKLIHEIKIINRLKGLSCAFIPRFYQVAAFYPHPFTQSHKLYVKKYQNVLLSELTCSYGQPGYNMGNLISDRWQCLSLKKVVYIMSQVAQALRFLHLNKIVHLDLKPQNILFIKNFTIKLIDFGQSFHPLVPYEGKN